MWNSLRSLYLLAAIAGPATLHAAELQVGCPWDPEAVNINTNNFGYPDAAANYAAAVLPNQPEAGAYVTITGTYPKVRYFSFQIDNGFQLGNLTDQIADANIISTSGLQPDSLVSVLPPADFTGYTDQYQVTVVFSDPPQAPAPRAPNTLYAGAASSTKTFNKQLVMRMYLPNPDTNIFGDTPLPDLVLHTSTGDIDFNKTTDQIQCITYNAVWNNIQALVVPGVGLPNPVFKPVTTGGGSTGLYPNGDSTYLRSVTSTRYTQMAVVRAKAPSFPPLPPELSNDANVRYWSLCENELNSTHGVGCIADRDMVLQSDGYFTAVISPDAYRPTTADAAHGYNWITWGQETNAFIAIRQILADPDFPGNYQLAVNDPKAPLTSTLGEWAPDITYCDVATFDANSAAGGLAVMNACKAATNAKAAAQSHTAAPTRH